MTMINEQNLVLNLPEDLLIALHAIADEREMVTEELIRNSISEYLQDLNRKPPTVGCIVKKLHSVQAQYEELKVRHIYLFGSMVHGSATRWSDINLLLDIEGHHTLNQRWEIRTKIYNLMDKKHIISLAYKDKLSPEKLDAIMKDAVKIF